MDAHNGLEQRFRERALRTTDGDEEDGNVDADDATRRDVTVSPQFKSTRAPECCAPKSSVTHSESQLAHAH